MLIALAYNTHMMITVEYANRQYGISANIRETSDEWLVFMHGWGAAKESFSGAFDYPGFDKYSMCAFDFVGYGQSDRPDDFSYDLADQAKIAEALIRSLEPRRVVVIGHSMGGGIGLLCAGALSDIPCTFISVEGNLVPEDTSKLTRMIAAQPYERFRYVGFYGMQAALRLSPLKKYRTSAKWWHNASPRAIHASAQSLVVWSDQNEQIPLFKSLASKAYIYGDQSSKKIQHVLPRLAKEEVTTIAHSGHLSMLDNPAEFYSAIARIADRG
jgi:pimeloyl-ACP methyl ester carboxylesterase